MARQPTMALLRYNSAMATIQVRELPEDLYEVLRRRARRAGQSLQAYMRDQVVAMAERPTKDELIDEIEHVLSGVDGREPTAASVIEDLAAERR
jgi:plasmid stability protein